MQRLKYHLLDVFTTQRFGGNQLAVFEDGRGLSTELMQKIAAELNLSETTFIFPPENPENHFKIRIFTPAREIPMAGHPTVGTAYLITYQEMYYAQTDFILRLEENVGLIPVEVKKNEHKIGQITMQQPKPVFGDIFSNRAEMAALFSLKESDLVENLPVQTVSCGVPYWIVPLKDFSKLTEIEFRLDLWKSSLSSLDCTSVYIYATHPDSSPAEYKVRGRMFGPAYGIPEDPATGSANGPLGSYLAHYQVFSYDTNLKVLSEQGFEMGRPSYLHLEIGVENNEIEIVKVGGESVYVGQGEMFLEEE
jgi:trans-2,3-dihydro-3-hydroxyanthranilate isomerase